MRLFKNKLAVTVIVLSVSFLGITIYSVKRESGNIFSSGVGSALNPVQKGAYFLVDKVRNGVDFFLNFSNVKKENDELKAKNLDLQNKLIEYDNLKSENDRLRKMLDFKNQREDFNYVGAHIIGKMGGSILNGYIIDRGSNDNLAKDMIVISAEGLVGQVVEVNDNWSKVESLVNENIAVSALVQSTKESTGIIKGFKDYENNLMAKLYFLPLNSKIKEGDIITTSGLGGLYPANIRIGEVVSVEEDKVKVNKSAVVKPYVDFNKLEELFVVVPKNYKGGEVKY